MKITTTELQNNFGKYLKLMENEDIIITKNGKVAARLIPSTDEQENIYIRESAAEYSHAGMKVTYEEFLEINEKSENRYEYIDGEIYQLASPLYDHQRAIREIYSEFVLWFRNKKCEPLAAPFDVTLFKSKTNANVVQPDIMVICDKENIDKKGRYTGVPSLVVEVLSESTRSKDSIKKLDLYMLSGVNEYWIVNTFTKEIFVYTFKNKSINSIKAFKSNDRIESDTFTGLEIELLQVFG